MLNLPNVLTLIRLALIPVFIILFYWPTDLSNLYAAIVFIIAALTDLLDGYLARKLKLTTKFGAFLALLFIYRSPLSSFRKVHYYPCNDYRSS